jgi:hypothetical protein
VGALAEGSAIGLLADEGDEAWAELDGDAVEPFCGPGEICPAQVA